jgi:predicted TIM-barrel fold metal-dependent hydrolase
MNNFIFSMDSHVVEPKTLWQDNLPARFKDRALHTERQDKYIVMVADKKPLHRMQVGDGNSDNPRIGGTDPELRVKDMARDGIDAELIFPNLGNMIYAIEDGELALACARVYNDWVIQQFGTYRDTFVPAAALPMRDVAETMDEFRRVLELGYRAVMLPTVTPGPLRYNDPALDPIWALAEERRIPIAFHIATGHSPVFERGAGAAVINYTKLSFLTQELVAYLVCSGALDRHPGLRISVIEAGASWIAGLGERMDESYDAHRFYVRPLLSRKPSEILHNQVLATFQFDRACLRSIGITGHKCLVWASDYPHMEGTFPNSQAVVDKLFDGVQLSDSVKADILGGNAAELFGIKPSKLSEKFKLVA